MHADQGLSELTAVFAPATAAALNRALSLPGGLLVCDADGTLWRSDIGEGFLQHLIAERVLVAPELEGLDVWAEYERRVAADRTAGFAWAAQVMAGLSEAEVRRHAEAFAQVFVPAHLHPEMRVLLGVARRRGVETWIVSASNHWIVTAAAPLAGVSPGRVLGIRVQVREGVLTSEAIEPITNRAGKVDAIRQAVGRSPVLVAGDSLGDLEMLQMASEAALLMVRPRSDPALVELGRRSGWLLHELREGT